MSRMANDGSRRWDVARLSGPPAARTRPVRWRSRDLKGPLPLSTVRALEIAIRSLPTRAPWPEVDEDGWWREVLRDRRLRRSAAKIAPGERRGCRPAARPPAGQVANVFLRVVRPARHAQSHRADRDVRVRSERALDRPAHPQMSRPALAPRGQGMSDHLSSLTSQPILDALKSTAPGAARQRRRPRRHRQPHDRAPQPGRAIAVIRRQVPHELAHLGDCR
jgi:hypothetical protein